MQQGPRLDAPGVLSHVKARGWHGLGKLFRDNQINQVEGDILIILLSKPTICALLPDGL